MITLYEDVTAYAKEDLYDLISNNSELNRFSKNLIYNFVDECSVQLSGIDHQMTRQPLTTELYKESFSIKSEFVKLIKWLIETDIESQTQLDKRLDNYLSTIRELIDKLSMYVSDSVSDILEKHYNNLEIIISKFKSNSSGLVEIDETDDSLFNISNFNVNTLNDFNSSNSSNSSKQSSSKSIKKFRLLRK